MACRVFLLAMALLGLATSAWTHMNGELVLTEKANGERISVRKGTRVEVRLPAQLGTGYMWKVIQKPSVLDAVGEAVETPKPQKEKKVGGEEVQNFSFIAARAGTGILKLVYDRGWQKDTPPQKSFLVTLSVTE